MGPPVRQGRSHLFSPSADDDYAGPFTSEATFLDGQLQGVWTKDAAGQKIVEWNFDKGLRSGPWTFWHSNGKKRLEAMYRAGTLTGNVIEYDRDEKEIQRITYSDGKRMTKAIGWHTRSAKSNTKVTICTPTTCSRATYDWWRSTVTVAPAAPATPEQKHGVWISWHRNGNKESQAQYDHDMRVGKFQWWYENGQPQAEGSYDLGKKIGAWITWHPNGQKESLAEYQNDQLVGRFSHWDPDGKLIESKGDARQFTSDAAG